MVESDGFLVANGRENVHLCREPPYIHMSNMIRLEPNSNRSHLAARNPSLGGITAPRRNLVEAMGLEPLVPWERQR